MLTGMLVEGKVLVFFKCDQCNEEIENLDDGMAFCEKLVDDGDSSPLHYIHRDCMKEFEDDLKADLAYMDISSRNLRDIVIELHAEYA